MSKFCVYSTRNQIINTLNFNSGLSEEFGNEMMLEKMFEVLGYQIDPYFDFQIEEESSEYYYASNVSKNFICFRYEDFKSRFDSFQTSKSLSQKTLLTLSK